MNINMRYNTYAIASENEVRLKAHLVTLRKGRVHLRSIRVIHTKRHTHTLQQHLQEDLGVKRERGCVEGNGLVPRHEGIGPRDRVRSEEVDQLCRRETTIGHARENCVGVALREGDGAVVGGEGGIGSAREELKLRGTLAVGTRDIQKRRKKCDEHSYPKESYKSNLHSNGTSELDEITRSHIVVLEEGRKRIDRIIDTRVRSKVGFNIREDDHGSIRACSLELARKREPNSVVECQTERLMDVFAALALEQIALQVIQEREEHTTLFERRQSLVSDLSTFIPLEKKTLTASLAVTLPSGQVTRLMLAALAAAAKARVVAAVSLNTMSAKY